MWVQQGMLAFLVFKDQREIMVWLEKLVYQDPLELQSVYLPFTLT